MRNAAIFKQANDRWHGDDGALRVKRKAVLLLSARDAFEHQHQSAAGAADVDGFVGGVQQQDRHLQNVCVGVSAPAPWSAARTTAFSPVEEDLSAGTPAFRMAFILRA